MVYVFLADGFEEVEAVSVIDILRRSKLEVTSVGVQSKNPTGAHGIKLEADKTLEEFKLGPEAKMIVLPGGMPGVLNLKKSKQVIGAIEEAQKRGIYIAAICAAPTILGELNLLEGKQAVCFPGMEAELRGAKVCKGNVVADGNIITGTRMEAAIEFANELVKALLI